MPKIITKQLSNFEVQGLLEQPGLHSVGGVTGLKLQVAKSLEAKSWILRATVAGKVSDIGLGGYPTISLKAARGLAKEIHVQIQKGINPIEERKHVKEQLILDRISKKTFNECMELCIKSIENEWTNPKTPKQWNSSLNTYACPIIGNLPVSSVTTEHILQILDPIWTVKPETASRVRSRIEKILAYATTRGYRSGDNPARFRGHLDTTLSSVNKLKGNNHHPALDYNEIGSFMKELHHVKGLAAKALELAILTATRSGEARGAKWDEFDLNKKQWTIPAGRMKAKKQHIVPLSNHVMNLLNNLPKKHDSDYLFTGIRGGAMSDMSLSKIVKNMHKRAVKQGNSGFIDKDANNRIVTPHGFRSTFRDWAGEQSSFSREVIEHALAHQLKDKAEAAYQRKTSIPKRIKLMQTWSDYCDKTTITNEAAGSNVIAIKS